MNMLKKSLIIILVALILHTTLLTQTILAGEKLTPEQVKATIAGISTNSNNIVKLKLTNKKRLQGYVRTIEADSFILIDSKQGAISVSYADVQELKEVDPKNEDIGTFAKKQGLVTVLAVGASIAVVGIIIAASSD
ncbi:MAG: hypothetical protein AB1489_36775 [Acidobacteriota bacterium]